MDFNPVLSAIRLIGSNCQNYAVVNASGNLNAAAIQTSLSYAAGDVSAGKTRTSPLAHIPIIMSARRTLFLRY